MELPATLLKAARERRLLPIIGAGFTKNINPKIPDWSQVIKIAAKDLGYDPEIMQLHGDYLQIAEFYDKSRSGIKDLTEQLKIIINSDSLDINKSPPHCLLPFLDVAAIYTTNWDSWIERGFEKIEMPYEKVVTADDLAKTSHHNSQLEKNNKPKKNGDLVNKWYPKTQIIKFHGDFDSPDTIVVSESHYFKRMEFEDPLDIRLRADIIGKSVIFIGYSFSDLNIRYMWYKLKRMMETTNNSTTSFFITHNPNLILENILKSNGIELVLIDDIDIKNSLKELFERLIEVQEDSK